jgi:arginine deiminase
MILQVTSEFGYLREAIVHRPGRELVRMTPSTRDFYLFDDLLFDEHAQQEHDWFTDLLRNHLGVKVHFFGQLLAEAIEAAPPAERQALISQVCRLESDMPPVEQRIGQLEVLVRWFQGHGWPQYTQDPEGRVAAGAPGTARAAGVPDPIGHHPPRPAPPPTHVRDTAPLAERTPEAPDYLRHRLEAWCAEGDFRALAEELIEGIESEVDGASPSGRPGPFDNGSETGSGSRRSGSVTKTKLAQALEDVEALRRFVEGQLFYLTPLPNLMFVRDVAVVIGRRLLLARMAAPGRRREPLLFDFVQRNHPMFKDSVRWTWADIRINDPAWATASSPSLHMEGGNIMQLREDVVVIGVSRRTSLEAVQRIADVWRAHAIESGKHIVLYVLRLPAGVNHLDSVFGVIGERECVVYPPVFEPYGPASVDVVRVELSRAPVRPTRSADFFESLHQDGMHMEPIPCGGSDPVDQQREQWFSAANLLAVAPGKVIIYRSCERTVGELAKRGYRVVDINDVQTGAVQLSLSDPGKWVLKIKGSELSRGHGGPHSLIVPLVREA